VANNTLLPSNYAVMPRFRKLSATDSIGLYLQPVAAAGKCITSRGLAAFVKRENRRQTLFPAAVGV